MKQDAYVGILFHANGWTPNSEAAIYLLSITGIEHRWAFQLASRSGVVSFENRAPLLWNSLPEHVRASKTPAAFRSSFLASIFQVSSHTLHSKIMALALGNP